MAATTKIELKTQLEENRKQLHFFQNQLNLLQDQYRSSEIRLQRAIRDRQRSFEYVLHLRLLTLEAVIRHVYDLTVAKSVRVNRLQMRAESQSDDEDS